MKVKMVLFQGWLLLGLINIQITMAQSLDEMMRDNEMLTTAYSSFVQKEYKRYNDSRAQIHLDFYNNGNWQIEDCKKAVELFETVELKRVKAPLEQFEMKYGEGNTFMEKFRSERETQMKLISAHEKEIHKRVKVEAEFKEKYNLLSSYSQKYRQKIDEYDEYRKALADRIYDDAVLLSDKIGKYNKDVIHEEMKKLFNFALWLNPGHTGSKTALSTLN